MKTTTPSLYRRFLKPRSADEDTQRKEFIFTLLLLGALLIAVAAVAIQFIHKLTGPPDVHRVSPQFLLIPVGLLGGLYAACRYRYRSVYAVVFLGVFLVLATYAMYLYGYELPSSLLIYALLIVMAGIVISSRAAVALSVLIALCLSLLAYLQENGISKPDLTEQFLPMTSTDTILFCIILGVILLVSWLSSSDIERSLKRARSSEAALRVERANLEHKVRERTQEIERLQVEKTLQLHRFAEFGRQSSTLLHELANPLTSVSLDLEQLDHSEIVGQARLGVALMEKYVEAARRQIRNQSELGTFNSSEEILRVILYLSPKAKKQGVAIKHKLAPNVALYGDSIRFDQIIANLLANAIDASEGEATGPVTITSRLRDKHLEITVQDRGIGIEKANLVKIFEPFYTTKPIEQGTGIGLNIVKRAVTEHFKGEISVTSSAKKGTAFKVTLPRYVAD